MSDDTDYAGLAEQAYNAWVLRTRAAQDRRIQAATHMPAHAGNPFVGIAASIIPWAKERARDEALAPLRDLYREVVADADTDVDRYDDPQAMALYLLHTRMDITIPDPPGGSDG